MKKIVIIDNYDSFTFNLVHYFEALNCEVTVFRNDEFDLDELQEFDKIVLSPACASYDQFENFGKTWCGNKHKDYGFR